MSGVSSVGLSLPTAAEVRGKAVAEGRRDGRRASVSVNAT